MNDIKYGTRRIHQLNLRAECPEALGKTVRIINQDGLDFGAITLNGTGIDVFIPVPKVANHFAYTYGGVQAEDGTLHLRIALGEHNGRLARSGDYVTRCF